MDDHPEPGNLPRPRSPLVGRYAETGEIAALLEDAPLVTLTGPPGVGKSRTAVEMGRLLGPRFRDGAWLVDLASLQDAALVPNTVALTVRVRDQTFRPATDVLVEYLADRACLLILDGCEHVRDTCALLVACLIAEAPGCRIIATSRQPLDVPHERVRTLAPLPTTGDDEPAALRLFTERARSYDPDFSVPPAGRDALRGLCERLDGLPLALELAAAQLRHTTLAELAARPLPDVVFGIPEAGENRTLWGAIGWSHELCTPAERLVWARASVFAGLFGQLDARSVCAGGPLDGRAVAVALRGLVDKSVLFTDGDDYRFLDSVRAYGRWWLGELGEAADLSDRHADHYLDLSRRAFPAWPRSGQVAWQLRLSRHIADVRQAVGTLLDRPGADCQEITSALWFLWSSCEYEREGRDHLKKALDTGPSPMRVRTAWALGVVTLFQGDLDGIDDCVALCRAAAPDTTALRVADYLEATAWAMDGRAAEAFQRLQDLAAAPWDDPVQESIWLLCRAALAFALTAIGQTEQACALAEDLVKDGTDRQERKFRSWGSYILALNAIGRGDHPGAADHAATALDGFRLLNDSSNIALSLEALAIATADRNPARSARLLGESERLWNSTTGGRERFTTPGLAASRATCEQAITAAIGPAAHQAGFAEGLHSAR